MAGRRLSRVGGCIVARTIRDAAVGRGRRFSTRGNSLGIILVSFNTGRGVNERLIGENYGLAIIPTRAATSRVGTVGPSNMVLSGKPKSPSSGARVVTRLGGLYSFKVPAFNVYLNRRLLTLSRNTGARGLGCNRENTGRPTGRIRANEICVASRGRNCTIMDSDVPRGNGMDFMGNGSGAYRNMGCAGVPTFSIRFRPRTYNNPRSATFLFSHFVRLVGGGEGWRSRVQVAVRRGGECGGCLGRR